MRGMDDTAGNRRDTAPTEADGRCRIAQRRMLADFANRKMCGTCGRLSGYKGRGLVLCRRCASWYYSWPPYESVPDPRIMVAMPRPASRKVGIITRRGVRPELSPEENRPRWVLMAAAF